MVGEGPGNSPENQKAARGTQLPHAAAGAATVTGESRDISWDRPARAPHAGALRLITQGLSGHIKQMMIIMRLRQLLGKRQQRPQGEAQTTQSHSPGRPLVKDQPPGCTKADKLRQTQSGVVCLGSMRASTAGARSQDPCVLSTQHSLLGEGRGWVCFPRSSR